MFEEAVMRSRGVVPSDPIPDLPETLSRIALWMTNTLNCVPDGLLVTNSCGDVLFMNPRAEELTGWSFQEAARRCSSDVFRLVDPQTNQQVDSPLREAFVEEDIFRSSDCLLTPASGKPTTIEYTAAPVRTEEGEVVGALVVFREVPPATCGI